MQRHYGLILIGFLASCAADGLAPSPYAPETPAPVLYASETPPPYAPEPLPVALRSVVYPEAFVRASVFSLTEPTETEATARIEQSALARLRKHSILSIEGETYAVSPIVGGGSFGTFHVGLDDAGHVWGIKRLALPTLTPDSDTWILPTTEAEIRQEFGLAKHVLGDRLNIRHIAQSDEHVFVVMTLWGGGFRSLRRHSQDATHVIRHMLARVSQDAVLLHDAGYIHNDIRSENILWNAEGDFALWDFGLAQAVDSDGTLERVPFLLRDRLGHGTRVNERVVAPEVDTCRYNNKADTWSLGLVVLTDFSIEADDTLFGQAANEISEHKGAYTQWHERLAASMSGLSCDAIAHPDSVTTSPRHWYFAAMYNELNQRDPQLCKLVLQGMLVPDPNKRWDMRRVHAYIHNIVSAKDMSATQTNLAETDGDGTRAELVGNLRDIIDCMKIQTDAAQCLRLAAPEVPSQT